MVRIGVSSLCQPGWAWLGFGYWLVEEKSAGGFVGEMGFSDWKREIEPSLQGVPEVGWVLATRAHGKGYATEAVRAAIAWGEANVRSRRPEIGKMVCLIHPEHARSIRVAEECGFKQVQPTVYKGCLLYTSPSPRDRQKSRMPSSA